MTKQTSVLVLAGLLVTCASAQQFNRPTASLVINANDGPAYPMTINVRTMSVATMTWSGVAASPFILARSGNGSLSAGAAVFNGDALDLPVSPAFEILADGTVSPGVAIGSGGAFTLAVAIPDAGAPPNGISVGYHDAFQSLVFDPTAPGGYHLTAATRVDITQGPTVTDINLGDDSELVVTLPPGMTVPFYGTTYTALTLGSNGYIYLGAQAAMQNHASLTDITTGPPRIFGFFSDLDTANMGTERYLIDTNIPNEPGRMTFKMEFNGVGDQGVATRHHTFSVLVDNTGYLELAYASSCNRSIYDTMSGITPGIACTTPSSNLMMIAATGGTFGAPGQAFWNWFGNMNAPPPRPFNLAGMTLHFQPTGAGGVTQATNQYHMY